MAWRSNNPTLWPRVTGQREKQFWETLRLERDQSRDWLKWDWNRKRLILNISRDACVIQQPKAGADRIDNILQKLEKSILWKEPESIWSLGYGRWRVCPTVQYINECEWGACMSVGMNVCVRVRVNMRVGVTCGGVYICACMYVWGGDCFSR